MSGGEAIELEVVGQSGTIAPRWAAARSLVDELRALGRRAGHVTLLLGAELLRLRDALGIQRGGNRRSKTQNASLKWKETCAAETGLSYDTCERAMKLAQAARREVPELLEWSESGAAFESLPAARQESLLAGLRQVADGKTMAQMWFEFGLCRNGPTAPPKPTRESARQRLLGMTLEDQQAQAAADLAEVQRIVDGLSWHLLEAGQLATLRGLLGGWITGIDALEAARAEQEAAVTRRRNRGRAA